MDDRAPSPGTEQHRGPYRESLLRQPEPEHGEEAWIGAIIILAVLTGVIGLAVIAALVTP